MFQTYVKICFTLATGILAYASAIAQDTQNDSIKHMSGISIVGNKEAPRSLYIVPWHNTELEQGTNMEFNFIGNSMQPVDRESLNLELELYKLRTPASRIATD